MREAQFAGMEGETSCGGGFSTVGFVADDGVAYVGEVDTDLMTADRTLPCLHC